MSIRCIDTAPASTSWRRALIGALVVLSAVAFAGAAAAAERVPPEIPGVYDGVHPHWRDSVIISADGSYRRGNGDPGKWSFDGTTLTLKWNKWGAEPVQVQGSGRFASRGFTLIKRPHPLWIIGEYEGVHPHWKDSVTLLADGTYRRGNGDPGRWSFDGKTLVLHWTNWGDEPVVLQSEGKFEDHGFSLSKRGPAGAPKPAAPAPPAPPALPAPPPPPAPPALPAPPAPPASAPAAKRVPPQIPGLYDGVHPHWRDSVTISADGTYRRGSGDAGTWSFEGNILTLKWNKWGAEPVQVQGPGRFSSRGFTLIKRPHPLWLIGEYEGVHPHWKDSVTLLADGTYRRGNGDPGRWSFDGKTLVLHWTNWGDEPVVLQSEGKFEDHGFTLSKRGR